VHSIDTSSFLDAWTRHYPQDTFSTFWEHMDRSGHSGILKVSEEVVEELKKKDDGAAIWVRKRPHMIVPTDIPIQEKVLGILKVFPRLVNAGKSRSGGDPFVIAVALVNKYTVITGEGPGKPSKPHIPDVCSAMGVRCIGLVDFIRDQKWRL